MQRSGPSVAHIAFLVASVIALIAFGRHSLGLALPSIGIVVLAGVFYGIAHALRFGRLLILLIEMRFEFRQLLWTHFVTAWVGALLPFRLGEIFRVFRLSEVTESWRDGAAAYFVEKFFDGTFLLILAISVIGLDQRAGDLSLLAVTLSLVVGAALFVYWSLRGSIEYLSSLLLAGRSNRSLISLRLLGELRELHAAVVSKVFQRSLPLLGMTILIWAFELSAFVLLVGRESLAELLHGLLRALEGTLGAGRADRLQAYVVIVVFSLTLITAGLTFVRIGFGDWSRRSQSVGGYRLAYPRKRMGHG